MILYIDACVRDNSRTKYLSDYLMSKILNQKDFNKSIKKLKLTELNLPLFDKSFLKKRDDLIKNKDYSDPIFDLAHEFAQANIILISAPYWDLSFPAILKQYFEQVTIPGITFFYTENGMPKGLCKAKKLYYVTTAGGKILSEEYGFGYIKALSNGLYGIPEVILIKAEYLDTEESDVNIILDQTKKFIDRLF